MNLNLICAMNNTYSIGENGKLMFRIRKDLQRFKQITSNNTVLMGKATFNEMGKVLPNRRNIILSSNSEYVVEGGETFTSFDKALEQCKNDKEVFVIGGQNLFREAVKLADKVYLTIIDDNSYGDRAFPYEYTKQHFKVIHTESHEEDGLKFKFVDFVRKDGD